MTDRGEERRARPLHGLGGSGTGKTDQGEREADEAQGRPRGLGARAGRQERPWRHWHGHPIGTLTRAYAHIHREKGGDEKREGEIMRGENGRYTCRYV